MAYESSITTLSQGDNVRFTAARLSMLAPADRKRLEGRVGLVQGRWNYTRKLTVCFPEDSGRSELRILSVEPSQLERVPEDLTKANEPAAEAEATGTEAASGGEKLSQEELDNLFG